MLVCALEAEAMNARLTFAGSVFLHITKPSLSVGLYLFPFSLYQFYEKSFSSRCDVANFMRRHARK